MQRHLPLNARLSAFDGLPAGVVALGLITPVADDLLAFHARYPWGCVVHVVAPDELPAALRSAGTVPAADLHFNPSRPIEQFLGTLRLERIVVLEQRGVRSWFAICGEAPDVAVLSAHLLAGLLTEESTEHALARLRRIDQLEGLLETLAGALDIRTVFRRLGDVVERVLPFDAIVLMRIEGSPNRARVYARLGLETAQVPKLIDVPESVRDTNWAYFLIDNLPEMPDDGALMARQGMHSSLRVPIHLRGQLAGGINVLARQHRYSEDDVFIARRLADYVALEFSHEQIADERRATREASERAARLETRVHQLVTDLDVRGGYERVIGESAAWKAVLGQAAQVAPTDTSVLLLGDTGTGKEVLARFVHRASRRAEGPFVALNCAALPEHLLEAELFGFERGAFTGATTTRSGRIEQAAGGTLFLDEVGELSLPAQAKLLRVLQEREFQRLGSARMLPADIRVVAATNRDLSREIEKQTFREDLYYRLNVFPIRLPQLRDRPEDILPLSHAFVEQFGRTLGRHPSGISRNAESALASYAWPGNVRELRNVLERATILADGGLIVAEHLALHPASAAQTPAEEQSPPPGPEVTDLHALERATIKRALEDCRFNKSEAARRLGLSRAQLYVRLKRYGLE